MTKAARRSGASASGVVVLPSASSPAAAATARRSAPTSATPSSAVTARPSGTPSSTTNCSTRSWVWSKNATGRCGKAVNDQAKLNSPKPTPSQGCMRISASVFDQMPKRELETSPPVPKRVSPPKTWWL